MAPLLEWNHTGRANNRHSGPGPGHNDSTKFTDYPVVMPPGDLLT